MRTQRIKAGFHRIGIVGAVVCGIPAVLFFAGALYMLSTGSRTDDVGAAAAFGAAWALGACACYVASRAVGWVIAGFAGDENSN